MRNHLFTTIMLMLMFIPAKAQQFNPEEYRQKFEQFVTSEACLTKEECAKFFPLFQEYKSKKRQNYRVLMQLMKDLDPKNNSEQEFRDANNKILKAHEEENKIDAEYLKKFRKVLSDKKIFLLQRAELRFQQRALRKAGKKN
ncbi:MAG: hypothetical protein MJZ69_03240 [Bacteroidaceae bacterium]|nr:hypothetical protein [Candidatus Minthousia equi]MCQ2245788.1 hypothetical protein [Bacteroidaceae bacterium]MDO4957264.1 hypothetical protein [Bacteroidales bacterium]